MGRLKNKASAFHWKGNGISLKRRWLYSGKTTPYHCKANAYWTVDHNYLIINQASFLCLFALLCTTWLGL